MDSHVYHYNMPVDGTDIEAMSSPQGFLTDNCLRTLVLNSTDFEDDFPTNFVEPTWLTTGKWTVLPSFDEVPDILFKKNEPGSPIEGLAIPFNTGDLHWVVVYISLLHREAWFFDSWQVFASETHGSSGDRYWRAHALVTECFRNFEQHFSGCGPLDLYVDGFHKLIHSPHT